MGNPEFEVHLLNQEGIEKAKSLANGFDALLDFVKERVPEGRYLSIVRTKLEEASFFAKKGIAVDPTNQQ
jgi:hypothetical protein